MQFFSHCTQRYFSFMKSSLLSFAICLTAIVAATIVTQIIQMNYLLHYGFDPTFADSIIWLLGSGNATLLPLLWCICPCIAALWLVNLDRRTLSANWILRHRSFRELWLERVYDATATAFIIGIVTFASVALVSYFNTHNLIDFEQSHSVFAALADGTTVASPPILLLLFFSLALCLLASIAISVVFSLLYWVLSEPTLSFTVIMLLGLSPTHGSLSFVVDLAQGIGWPLGAFVNPLSFFYNTSSISYLTWLPGADHGLWLQMAVIAFSILLGIVYARKKEFLGN